MTRRTNSKPKMAKRKVNPLFRGRQGIGRPKIGFNGHEVTSVLFTDHSNGTSNLITDWQQVDCNNAEGINRAGTDVIKHYQEYKYLNAAIEWIPKIGPAATEAGARISIAYIDNPEHMLDFESTSAANRLAITKSTGNCKTYNAWERFTWRVPLTYRRKIFNIDPDFTAIGSRTIGEFERAVQGKVCIAIETVGATTSAAALGQWRCTSTTTVTGFTAFAIT